MTTVRLPDEMEKRLAHLSRSRKKSKSDIIKEALEVFLSAQPAENDSYSLGKDFFGLHGSGRTTLSREYKRLLKDKIDAKRDPH